MKSLCSVNLTLTFLGTLYKSISLCWLYFLKNLCNGDDSYTTFWAANKTCSIWPAVCDIHQLQYRPSGGMILVPAQNVHNL